MTEILNGLTTRVATACLKAVVSAVDDTTEIQLLKIKTLGNTTIEGVEHVQPYGLTAAPPRLAEAVLVALGRGMEHLVAVVVGDAVSRIKKLKAGEVCLYSQHGQTIHHTEDGVTKHQADEIHLNGASDYGVRFGPLKEAIDGLRADLNALVTAYNAHSGHGLETTTPSVVGVPSTTTVDAAKVLTVRVP